MADMPAGDSYFPNGPLFSHLLLPAPMKSSILVINCGSSSLKFALIDTASKQAILTGLAEKLGLEQGQISFKHAGQKIASR
jgi:hypothetical protein